MAMYPATVSIKRPEISSRLLLFLRPILLFPHLGWVLLYSIAAGLVSLAALCAIIVVGRNPRPTWEFGVRYLRYVTRLSAYASLLTDVYPPFHSREEGLYPVRIRIEYPQKIYRFQALFRGLILIPQFFFGVGYSFVMMFVAFAVFWVVLFRGRIPEGLWGLVQRYFVWQYRLNAYVLLLIDEYPPFNGLQPLAAEEGFAED
ncbi:MAG: DUF4389 domain-containing protein [Bacteroidota bacterium]|nr:DUF4389 domain-containing protein [Bacteroidota bacterium]